MINLKYKDAEELIKEGYVLLYRGNGLFSRFIKSFGRSPYSHVSIASWANGTRQRVLESIEYSELYGSRSVALYNQVLSHPGLIDVFAPCKFTTRQFYDVTLNAIGSHAVSFDGKAITSEFRRYTGLSYSYQRILFMLWLHTPFVRLFTGNHMFSDDLNSQLVMPVCSTAVAHFYSKHYTDLVKFVGDEYVEPGDLSRSPLLSYLFTLTP